MGIRTSPPHAGEQAISALEVGLDVNQAQILLAQVFPFCLEIVPVDSSPQIMSAARSGCENRIRRRLEPRCSIAAASCASVAVGQ